MAAEQDSSLLPRVDYNVVLSPRTDARFVSMDTRSEPRAYINLKACLRLSFAELAALIANIQPTAL